jgi:hypothetical protein
MSVLQNVFTIRILRVLLGLFFIILGILGVLPQFDEGIFSVNNQMTIEIIFGVVQIICGLILFTGLFQSAATGLVSFSGLIVLIFWLVRTALTRVIWLIHINNNRISFQFYPDFSQWILLLTLDLVIAASLLVVIKRYQN